MTTAYLRFLFILYLLVIPGVSLAEQQPDTAFVEGFYRYNRSEVFWLSDKNRKEIATRWSQVIAASKRSGFHSSEWGEKIGEVIKRSEGISDKETLKRSDRTISSGILAFLQETDGGAAPFSYRGIASNPAVLYYFMLSRITSSAEVDSVVKDFSPSHSVLRDLEKFFRDSSESLKESEKKALQMSIDHWRGISGYRKRSYIVINVPAGQLFYYRNDSVVLSMKVITGEAETPTFRFCAELQDIVTNPYWNVPRSIATKEMLPKIISDRHFLDRNNLQVLNAKGKVLDPAEVSWTKYSENNFPVYLRQSTGCDNSLGVLKFNIKNPYSIYLHDTNAPHLFLREKRYFSHGCIRLEKPFELAELLIPGKLNRKGLEACKPGVEPQSFKLTAPVPVFVIYAPAEISSGKLRVFPDEYRLVK